MQLSKYLPVISEAIEVSEAVADECFEPVPHDERIKHVNASTIRIEDIFMFAA